MGESRELVKCTRPSKLKFSTCVDSIRDNFKRISGINKNGSCKVKRGAIGDSISKVPEGHFVDDVCNANKLRHSRRRKSSFEMYLSTIPKLDPVDRTVGWVMMQPDNIEETEPLYISPKRSAVDLDCETSISRCESERGTHGRGTPPVRDSGQPRLDELFRKLQMKQEREARRVMSQFDEMKPLNNPLSNPLIRDFHASDFEQCNFIKFTSRTPKIRADILHKNSFYYNQETENVVPKSVTEHCCEWKECRTKFICRSDLLKHVQEAHLACLPSNEYQSQRKLTCQWRKCSDSKCYPARYKLLLHLQRCHCSDP